MDYYVQHGFPIIAEIYYLFLITNALIVHHA